MIGCTNMITKWWELCCDYCQSSDYWLGTKLQAIENFKIIGHGIVNKDGCFYNEKCYQNWLKQRKSMYD